MRLRGWVFAATGLLCAAMFVSGREVFPPPRGDAIGFVPAAIEFRAGHGLVQPIYPLYLTAADGSSRLSYPLPLFPWLVAALMPANGPRAAFEVVALFRVLSLLAAAALFLRAAGPGARGFGVSAAACGSLVGMCTSGMPTEGRPEALGVLVVLAATGVCLLKPERPRILELGVLLGLMGVAHPVGAIYLGLALGVRAAAQAPWKRAAGNFLAIGALSLAVAAAITALSPHGLVETLRATMQRVPVGITSSWSQYEWSYWLLAGRSSFSGLLLVAAAAVGAIELIRIGRGIAAPALLAAFALALTAAVAYTSLRVPARNYNLLMFSPLLYALLIRWVAEGRSRLGAALVIAIIWLTGAGFARDALAFPAFLAHGTGLDEARAAYARILGDRPGVSVLGSGWVLSDDYQKFQVPELPPARLQGAPRTLVVPFGGDWRSQIASLTGIGYVETATVGTPPREGDWMPAWATGFGFTVLEPRNSN
jgi:hypothetical protein